MNESDWLRHLLPLPRQVDIPASVSCPRDGLRVVVAGEADGVLAEARTVLEQTIGTALEADPRLTITLGRLPDLPVDAARLQPARHREQAYVVTCPSADTIHVAGGSTVGAFYGAVTLARLLGASAGEPVLEVPLAEIVDWPELEERGLWNFPEPRDWIGWMAGLKLNYGKMADTRLERVEPGRPGVAVIDADLMTAAQRRGFRYVPYILHLNFLHDIGLFAAYPELAGRGDGALAGRYFAHKQGNQHRAPCASQPLLVDLLADWMASIAGQGADEISCWLSERPCQCACERCTPVGQFLLETRAFLAAWERVRRRFPALRIRIFSSTTTPEQDDRLLAELPPEVRFERACATAMERWRHQPRDLFVNPDLDAAAAGGRWIASYDVPVGAYGNVDTPEFKVPQFSAQRIRDFVSQLARRRYAGAYAMLAWGTQAREVCGFSVCALAEYAWNPEGRSVEAFAAAWATQEGRSDPEAVGAWAGLLGDVEFDVYDSDFPMCYSWGRAAQGLEEGLPPRYGDGMFRHYRDAEDFDAKAAACERAVALVAEGNPDLALATRVVGSYVRLAQAVFRVSHLHAHATEGSVEDQAALASAVAQLEVAGRDNVAAIRAWRAHLGPEPWHHRVHDAIGATETTVRRMADHIRHRVLYG